VTQRQAFQWWVPALALLSLGALQAWELTLPSMKIGAVHRQRVEATIEALRRQTTVGPWNATDTELPWRALPLLRPMAYVSRRYAHAETNDVVGFVLIQVEDARDVAGHYPPYCYPGNGWELVNTVAASNRMDQAPEWVAGDLRIRGMEYEFVMQREGEQRRWVRDFFILPNGAFYPDKESFDRAEWGLDIRPYGATQVQVIFDGEDSASARDRGLEEMIREHRELIEAVKGKD
jgi:hypothetical protein